MEYKRNSLSYLNEVNPASILSPPTGEVVRGVYNKLPWIKDSLGDIYYNPSITNITDGYIPYRKLGDLYSSPIFTDGTNVGIGTVSPLFGTKLQIVGSSALDTQQGILQITTGTGVNTDNKLVFGINDGNYSWIQAMQPGISARNLSLQPSGGNVGIGTTAPVAKLEVVGGNSELRIRGTNISTISFYDGSGVVGMINTYNDGTLRFGAALNSNNNQLVLLNGGNVGIGTTTPGYKLDVNGDARFLQNVYVGGAKMLTEDGTGILKFGLAGGSQTAIYAASSEAIRIAVNGSVGIGTITPTQGKLQVQGNIFASMGSDSYMNFNPTSLWSASTALISSKYVSLGDIDGIGLGTALVVDEGTNTISITGKTSIVSSLTDTLKITNDTNSSVIDAFRVIAQGVEKFAVKTNGDITVNGEGKYTKQQYSPYVLLTVTAGATTWNLSTSQKAKVTLTGATTFNNPTNLKDGATYTLKVTQDATGGRLITWGTLFKFGSAGAPALSTLANKTDFLVFESDGTNLYYMGIKTGF